MTPACRVELEIKNEALAVPVCEPGELRKETKGEAYRRRCGALGMGVGAKPAEKLLWGDQQTRLEVQIGRWTERRQAQLGRVCGLGCRAQWVL